jgi:3-oxoadipate enol-lactonase
MKLDLALTRLAGTADAPDLLLLGPSLGTSVSALWGRCAAYLGRRFEVVGWDLPGHGHSRPATGPFAVEDLTDTIRNAAGALTGQRATWYAGVSLGGAVAFELALNPGPFRGVAALASAPRIGEPAAWQERADFVRRAGTSAMVPPSASRWFAAGFCEKEPSTVAALLTSLAEADQLSYAYACHALAAFDLTARLAEAHSPILIAAGERDEVVPPASARAAADTVPSAEFRVVTGCGHLPPAEDPAAVAMMLARFVSDQNRDPLSGDRSDRARPATCGKAPADSVPPAASWAPAPVKHAEKEPEQP